MSSFDEFMRNVHIFLQSFLLAFLSTQFKKKPCIRPQNEVANKNDISCEKRRRKNINPAANEQRNSHTCTPKIEPTAYAHRHTEIFHLWSNYNRNITLFTVVYSIFLCSIIIHCPQRHKHTSIEIYIFVWKWAVAVAAVSTTTTTMSMWAKEEEQQKKLSKNVIPYKCYSLRYSFLYGLTYLLHHFPHSLWHTNLISFFRPIISNNFKFYQLNRTNFLLFRWILFLIRIIFHSFYPKKIFRCDMTSVSTPKTSFLHTHTLSLYSSFAISN